MAWITPILNWVASNVVLPADLNRIEGNTQDLKDNKVDKISGKGLSTEDYTTAYKNKLDGIEAGAEVNVVTSVAGRTGDVAVSKDDVGLGSVQNYGIATQAEAEAGTSDVKNMTPLKTKQAVDSMPLLKWASGTYTGTDSKETWRTITIGVEPKLLLISTRTTGSPHIGVLYLKPETVISNYATTNSGANLDRLPMPSYPHLDTTTTGFTVRYDLNKGGEVYDYSYIY